MRKSFGVIITLTAVWLYCFIAQPQSVHARPDGATPGIVGKISVNGANYLLSTTIPAILQHVQNIQLPDISGEHDDFDYTVSGIVIQQVGFQQAGVSFNNGLSFTITGVSVALTCNWSFKLDPFPHIPTGSGTADVSTSSATMAVTLNVAASSTGAPQISVANIDVELNQLSVSVHNSAWSWLADLLSSLFNSQIKSAASSAIQSQLTNLINVMANQVLSTLPLQVPFGSSSVLVFSLVENPVFNGQYAIGYLEGAVENITNPQYPPVPHAGIPLTPSPKMASLDMDEFVINSGFWVAYTSGEFMLSVSDAQIPPESPIRLNTSTFRVVIPPLYSMYPNMLLELFINATEMPTVSITPTGSLVHLNFDVTWQVNQSFVMQEAFVMNLDMNFAVSLGINSTTNALTAELKVVNITIAITQSAIGAFNPALLQGFFTGIISGPVVGLINQAIAKGIQLPTVEGLSLVDPVLTEENGYIHVDSDLKFVPPTFVMEALDRVKPL